MDEISLNYLSKQIKLDEVGLIGQNKICSSKILIVGAGGLGNPVAQYLACAGIGEIGLIDGDRIELSNLNRQVCFNPNDIGLKKVDILKDKIKKQNPKCSLITFDYHIDINNIKNIISKFDLILDCTDNLKTKFLLHDFCFLLNKDLLQASVYKFEGKLLSFPFSKTKKMCWRCLWPEIPISKSCTDVGVLGALVGVFGSMLALEALKLILRIDTLVLGEELLFDCRQWETRRIRWKKNEECSFCQKEHICIETNHFEVSSIKNFKTILTLGDQSDFKILNSKQFKYSEIANLKKIKGDIVFVCEKGNESYDLVQNLRKMGMDNVYSLRNGQVNLRNFR